MFAQRRSRSSICDHWSSRCEKKSSLHKYYWYEQIQTVLKHKRTIISQIKEKLRYENFRIHYICHKFHSGTGSFVSIQDVRTSVQFSKIFITGQFSVQIFNEGRSEWIWSKAIGFSDFGWSNNADNMQQDLTLAQCKSKFRIFQVGIRIKESLRIDKISMIKLSRDPWEPCRIGWAPEEWNEGQCVPKRDRSGEVVEGADWCNFERVPLCEIFSIETGEKLKVVNRHYC